MHKKRSWMKGIILLALLWLSSISCAADWVLQGNKSKLTFRVSYEEQPIVGEFKKFDVMYEQEKLLDVVVDISSADMGSSDINDTIQTADWFNAAKFTQAKFHANKIDKVDEAHFIAHGNLSLKGVNKTLDLPFTWRATKEGADLKGEVTLQRTEFNIGAGQWASDDAIGLTVKVAFSVELKEKH